MKMKFSLLYLTNSIVLCTFVRETASGFADCCGLFARNEDSEDNFSAVTSFGDIDRFYDDMQIREPHYQPDTRANNKKDVKARICKSISSSGYMEKNGEDPSHMESNYLPLTFSAWWEACKAYDAKSYYRTVLNDYEIGPILNMGYNFRSRLIDINGRKEFAFACATKRRKDKEILIYYISDPYTIDLSSEDQVSVRFICLMKTNTCSLKALAETPAIVFTHPMYPVEDIYLQLRKFYKRAEIASQDPLCALRDGQKIRICASIMNSSFFVGKVKYIPDYTYLSECERKNVSLETEEAKMAAADEVFEEWMFQCQVKPLVENAAYVYFVSRAYHSYHVIVYSYHLPTKGWRIENISGHISAIVDENAAIREDCYDFTPPNLVVLLRNSQRSAGGKING